MNDSSYNRRFIAFVAITFAFVISLLFMQLFLWAYAHDYTIGIAINEFNEATIELVMFLVLYPIITVGVFYAIEYLDI